MSESTSDKVAALVGSHEILQVHVSRRMLLVLVLTPWLIAGALFLGSRSSRPAVGQISAHLGPAGGRVTQARSGPWGNIEFTRIDIEPPKESLFVVNEPQSPPDWFFGNHTEAAVVSLFEGAQLSPAQHAALRDATPWEVTAEGVRIRPAADLVLGLSAAARRHLYTVLALYPENRPQATAFSFNPAFLTERLEVSGLSEGTLSLFRSLLYWHGNLLLFADLNVVLPRLTDERERVRFVKTLARRNTLLATLRINEQTDVEKLVAYWGFDGRSKDLRPLLESLRRVPGGATLDLAHLLPPFARRRIYTYPAPSGDPVASWQDGLWSSLNFFNETPEDWLTDQQMALAAIWDNYFLISTGAQLGDLVVLQTRGDQVVQVATYVADDVVFAKNGPEYNQPWMFQRLGEMVGYHSAFYPPNEPLIVRILRSNQLVPTMRPSR